MGRGGGDSWRGSACVWFGDSCGRGAGGKAAPPAEGHFREALGAGAGTTGSSCLPTPTSGSRGGPSWPWLPPQAWPTAVWLHLGLWGLGARLGQWKRRPDCRVKPVLGRQAQGGGPQGARGQKGSGSPQAASLRCPPPPQLAQRFCRKHLTARPISSCCAGTGCRLPPGATPLGAPPDLAEPTLSRQPQGLAEELTGVSVSL